LHRNTSPRIVHRNVNHRFVIVVLRSRRPFRTKLLVCFIVLFVYLTLRTISLHLVPCYLTLPKGTATKVKEIKV